MQVLKHAALRFAILMLFPGLTACSSAPTGDHAPPPGSKAEPVHGEGLKNTFNVTPDVLRGGQPTKEGMRCLEGKGVKTVINLRAESSDAEATRDRSLKVVDVPFKTWKADHETLVAFLRAVTKETREGKVFFH